MWQQWQMGSNCNGVEVGLNKYPIVWNLPSLYSIQLGSTTVQNKRKVNIHESKSWRVEMKLSVN